MVAPAGRVLDGNEPSGGAPWPGGEVHRSQARMYSSRWEQRKKIEGLMGKLTGGLHRRGRGQRRLAAARRWQWAPTTILVLVRRRFFVTLALAEAACHGEACSGFGQRWRRPEMGARRGGASGDGAAAVAARAKWRRERRRGEGKRESVPWGSRFIGHGALGGHARRGAAAASTAYDTGS